MVCVGSLACLLGMGCGLWYTIEHVGYSFVWNKKACFMTLAFQQSSSTQMALVFLPMSLAWSPSSIANVAFQKFAAMFVSQLRLKWQT